MKRIILVLLLAISFEAQAQILKETTIVLPDSSTISYLTNQGKMNGLYTVKKVKTDIGRGNYVDDKRVGNWYFFNKDKSLFMRYNYDTKKLLFVDDKALAMGNVEIKTNDNEVKTNASVTMPVYSLEHYIILAARASMVAIPKEDQSKLANRDITLVAAVAKDGTAQYFARYELKGNKYERKLSLGKLTIDWLPAKYKETAYDSEFLVKTQIDFNAKSDDLHRRFNWF